MLDPAEEELGLSIERAGDHELLKGQFRDFDELSAATAGWDLDFVQLDSGPAASTLTQVSAPGLSIQRFRFGRTYRQRGATPPTMRAFGFVESNTARSHMSGHDLTTSDLALFRTGGELEAVSQAGHGCVAILIDEARIDEAFEAVNLPHRSGGAEESRLLRIDPNVLRPLRRHAMQIVTEFETNPRAFHRSQLLEELSRQLPTDLALAIQSVEGDSRQATSRVRDLALRRAVSFIEDHPDGAISIGALSKEVGVGWTTLVSAFREHFGVTPKSYVRATRLNGVRKALRAAEPETAIADVANHWGFWHLGQFAADYKRLFGELPSDTRGRISTQQS